MAVRFIVLKPFRFSQKDKPERQFIPGEYLLEPTDDVLQSDWVKAGADGCVELLPATRKRLKDLVTQHQRLVAHHKRQAEDAQKLLDDLNPLAKPAPKPEGNANG